MRIRIRLSILGGVIVTGGLLLNPLFTTVAHASSPPSSSPNPTPLLQTFPPSPGFNPLTASKTQLIKHGFPPRPTTPLALSAWKRAMTHAKHYVAPNPIYSSVRHQPPTHQRHSVQYSNNWAGHIVPQSVHNNVSFTYSAANWVQPSVAGNSAYTNYNNAPDASFWTGLGVSYLIQAGADSIATSTPQYRFWTEDYPANSVWEGPTIRPGDLAYVSVQYNGNNTATYFLEDYTTGQYSSFTNSAPYVGYKAANFINERVANYYLPNFGNTNFSNGYLGNGSTTWPLTTANNIFYMTSSNGTLLSSPGPVNNATAGFPITWKNPGP